VVKSLIILILLLASSDVKAVTRWATPTGLSTGTCTTTGTACTLTQLVSQCVAGDTCILRNGIYSSTKLVTVRAGVNGNPIIFKAENPQKARVQGTFGIGPHNNRILSVLHAYIEVYDIVFDGLGASSIFGIDGIDNTTGVATGVKLVGNIFQNGQGSHFGNLEDTTIRWNLIQDERNAGAPVNKKGEMMYIGSENSDLVIQNVDISVNRVRRGTWEHMDTHPETSSLNPGVFLNVSHNILEDVSRTYPRCNISIETCASDEGGDDSMLSFAQSRVVFSNNIVRIGGTDGFPLRAVASIRGQTGSGSSAYRHTISNNVWYDIKNLGGHVFRANAIHTGTVTPTVLTGNTFCGFNTYGFDPNVVAMISNGSIVLSGSNPGLNAGGRPQGECDSEVTRIRSAIATLFVSDPLSPRNRWVGPSFSTATTFDATHTDILFTNNNFPPIKAPDHTKCTIEESIGGGAFVNRAVTAGILAPSTTNILRLTHATLTGGSVLRVTCTSSAVSDSANVLAENLNIPSVAFTSQPITNTISGGGGGPTNFVITQSNFQFYNSRLGANGAIESVAPINTHKSAVPGAVVIFVGQLDATVAAPPEFAVNLRYSKNGGAYVPIPEDFGIDNIRAFGNFDTSLTIPLDDTPIVSCLAGVLSNVQGSIQRTANAVPNILLDQNQCIAVGTVVEFDADVVPNVDVYKFRYYNQDETPFTYTEDKTGQIITVGHNAGY
jgi:hypothetical protein